MFGQLGALNGLGGPSSVLGVVGHEVARAAALEIARAGEQQFVRQRGTEGVHPVG